MSVHGGILVVDKPEGPTSHDVVAGVRRAFGTRRVGHCGTLDPLATGVLVVCVGPLTRLSDWLSRGEKEYAAVFCLGGRSDTDDTQGQVTPVEVGVPPSADRVVAAMERFVGVVHQVPPVHSAVKVNGVRSYARARRRQPVALAPRAVRIERFEAMEYRYPRLAVRVQCGKGTYVRSLARDLGVELGCGAYVERLRRLRVGSLTLDDAVAVDRITDSADAGELFVNLRRALEGILKPVHLDDGSARLFGHGGAVPGAGLRVDSEFAVFAAGRLLGVGRTTAAGLLQPVTVLGEPGVLGAPSPAA